jgi:Icc protein
MGLEDGETLLRLLQRHSQVQAVVAGHVHQAFDAQLGGLRLLTTPSTCSQALPGQDAWVSDTKGPGFRWFELSAERMKTGILRAEGPPERWSQGGF